jgi:hypothetical protein
MELDGPALRRGLEILAGHAPTCRGMLFAELDEQEPGGLLWRFRCSTCGYASGLFMCELIDDPRPPYARRYT